MRLRSAVLGLLLLVVLAGGLTAVRGGLLRSSSTAAVCPPGFESRADRIAEESRAERAGVASQDELDAEKRGEAGTRVIAEQPECAARKRPEPRGELMTIQEESAKRYGRESGDVREGARAAAVARAQAIEARGRTLPGTGGTWQPAGKGPLIFDDPRYDEVNGSGLSEVQGRPSDFALDPATGRVYAAIGEGGVWVSDDRGGSWRSIGDNLPTQAIGGIAFSPADGGTVIITTGDNVFGGGGTFAGMGAFRSSDGGATWTKATGIPEGIISFRVAVDPSNPNVVYAATGGGLFRSADAGRSYENVALPVGDCAGKPAQGACFLANMVTDVVVQGPANDRTPGAKPGAVVAAVGWRAGNKVNVRGFVESPGNGIYRSDTGAPGTFAKAGQPTNTDDIGRVELGEASGPQQDHNYIYAIVEDAGKFNGEPAGIDTPGNSGPAPNRTYLNGIYVSDDFGASWTLMQDGDSLSSDPTSGSALTGTACATGYCPGIQAWYNLYIRPDTTVQTEDGVPTRLVFGLEEIWGAEQPGGLGGPTKFEVVAPYYSGDTCLFLNLELPACPTTAGDPTQANTTTHPDQHSAIWVPESDGGVTLMVAHDGGVNAQRLGAPGTADDALSPDRWGRGANRGFNTLLPYDAQVAKDGVIYAGLQDNGEMRIEPDGKQYAVYGGDGGFSAVDPDNSDIAYEQYVLNDISATTDGGKTWTAIPPPTDTYQFINPFVMDPLQAKHLLTAGTSVYERVADPTSGDWTEVFDLGTRDNPGTDTAGSTADPNNLVSAVDVRSIPGAGGGSAPAGSKPADLPEEEGGAGTVPGGGTGAPGTFDDREFTIAPGERAGQATILVKWASDVDDWDLRVLKDVNGTLTQVGSSAQGGTTSEQVVLTNPGPGRYVIRVDNYLARGTFTSQVAFTPGGGTDVGEASAAYVAFCAPCDVLNSTTFSRGLATNVKPDGSVGRKLKSDNWRIAAAKGLPNQYLTSVQLDPADPKTVYVTAGGYSRRWLRPGALGESDPGRGHVFKSTDAGETFTDITGDLPDVPANWSLIRNGQLVVATDVGVFTSRDTNGGTWEQLGDGLPAAPVFTLELKPKASPSEPDTLIAATQGRGVYRYVFADPAKGGAAAGGGGGTPGTTPTTPATPTMTGASCVAGNGFRSVAARPRGRGATLAFSRRVRRPVTVDVFQTSRGRTVLPERLIARFSRRTSSVSWNGRANRRGRRVTDGVYIVRWVMRYTERGRARTDVRRVVLRRSGGRFRLQAPHYRKASCGLLESFKLERPVFGGPRNRDLLVAFRLSKAATVRVEVLRGTRVVRRLTSGRRQPGRTVRLRFPAKTARRGEYRVRLTVTQGSQRIVSTLTSRRL